MRGITVHNDIQSVITLNFSMQIPMIGSDAISEPLEQWHLCQHNGKHLWHYFKNNICRKQSAQCSSQQLIQHLLSTQTIHAVWSCIRPKLTFTCSPAKPKSSSTQVFDENWGQQPSHYDQKTSLKEGHKHSKHVVEVKLCERCNICSVEQALKLQFLRILTF